MVIAGRGSRGQCGADPAAKCAAFPPAALGGAGGVGGVFSPFLMLMALTVFIMTSGYSDHGRRTREEDRALTHDGFFIDLG
ncbi:hypothetical protein NDU88_002422 [Pleurodeles waltl]|uniref:Uncharacterized protein n=1 Tax=Pleurodeles waltl TaxID=8319 RepID=A0AAV7T2B9_PLEWA|nr:hypothetical protein NDU88_002422 [Pleurodeles waltl]